MTATRAGIAVSDAQVRRDDPGAFRRSRSTASSIRSVTSSRWRRRSPPRTPAAVRAGSPRKPASRSLIPTAIDRVGIRHAIRNHRLLKLLGEKRDVTFAMLPPRPPMPPRSPRRKSSAGTTAHGGLPRAGNGVARIRRHRHGDDAGCRSAPADEATLRQRFEQEKARFIEPDQRLASHILIKVDPKASPAAQKAAEAKATELAAAGATAGRGFRRAGAGRIPTTPVRKRGRRRPGLGGEERDGEAVRGRPVRHAARARSAARSRPTSAGT